MVTRMSTDVTTGAGRTGLTSWTGMATDDASRGAMLRPEAAPVGEHGDGCPVAVDDAGEIAVRACPSDRAGPGAVELDQASARCLEPAQHALGLLGGRRGYRSRAGDDGFGG